MKTRKVLALTLALMLLLCGCGKKESEEDTSPLELITSDDTDSDTDSSKAEATFINDSSEAFTDRDYEVGYDQSSSTVITLNGSSASCSSNAVKINGGTVTITDEGTYIISGTLNDGMIIVDADESDKPQIVLNGVSITSKTSAAIYILEADKVFVTLAEGSSNTLTNGGSFTSIDDSNIDGTVFSKQDLTFNGMGNLTVSSPAGHGIVCKDDLVFTSGTYTVNSSADGVQANDSVRIANATLNIDAGKDGIQSENAEDSSLGFVYMISGNLKIEAEGDGITAGYYAQIEDGTVNITAGGGSENGSKSSSDFYGGFMGGRPDSSSGSSDSGTSMKGIKSESDMLIKGGTFTINSADDSLHSNTSLTVNGGTFDIASGDDAIHAEETLTVTSGTINISESYEGLEALNIKVSGGDIKLVASDDGINAAGGTDSSGTTGGRDGMFPGDRGGRGGRGGMSSNSNGSIEVSGGKLYINSSGDGFDANGTLTISGGYTVVVGPTQGDTATLDYDTSGIITGGTFIGTGASGMAQSFSESQNQGVIAVSVSNQSAGTKIALKDSKENTVLTATPELSFAVVILSSPDIEKGENYSLTVGSNSKTVEAS